ncbi:hypothetical protein Pelo_12158 [Pelomyxa schiedti]|nr:hypothetical protein Pelo_12158 [Pelomyxa schiedti]
MMGTWNHFKFFFYLRERLHVSLRFTGQENKFCTLTWKHLLWNMCVTEYREGNVSICQLTNITDYRTVFPISTAPSNYQVEFADCVSTIFESGARVPRLRQKKMLCPELIEKDLMYDVLKQSKNLKA